MLRRHVMLWRWWHKLGIDTFLCSICENVIKWQIVMESACVIIVCQNEEPSAFI